MSELLPYIFLTAVLIVAESAYIVIARRCGIIDRGAASMETPRIIVRGGGIIFLLGALLQPLLWETCYPWFTAGLAVLGAVTFADDIRQLSVEARLAAQAAAVVLTAAQLPVAPDLYIVPALIVCIGVVNAFNFMDGIDGMTGMYSLSVLLPLIYLNGELQFIEPSLPATATIAVLVFCLFNCRRRPVCFAGDIGAVTIGLTIVFALSMLIVKTGDFSYIVFLAVYGVDSVLTIIRRIRLGEKLTQGHRRHCYQLLANRLRRPHLEIAAAYSILQMLLSFGLILLPDGHYLYAAGVCVGLSAVYAAIVNKASAIMQEPDRELP